MGTVIDNLANVQPPVINTSILNTNSSSELVNNMISNANTTTDGLWFTWSIIVFWILIQFILMNREDIFQLDMARSLLVSSGWCLIISVGAALFTLTTSIFPIFWFTSIFFLSGLMVMRKSEQGR